MIAANGPHCKDLSAEMEADIVNPSNGLRTIRDSAWARVLLTAQTMRVAEEYAGRRLGGTWPLMRAAGTHVARRVSELARPEQDIIVMCGPGGNGGDGYVAACDLQSRRWKTTVLAQGPPKRGDALRAYEAWRCRGGALGPLSPCEIGATAFVVDALFGSGLTRPVDGAALAVLEAVQRQGNPCLAVDVPSGIDRDSGAVLGPRIPCVATVAFEPGPGHYLYPARAVIGDLYVEDIGITDEDIRLALQHRAEVPTFLNDPAIWRLRRAQWSDHKYTRGAALVVGGPMSGAGRLAAKAARRVGAGVVTVVAPGPDLPLFAADAPGLLLRPLEELADALADRRLGAVSLGCGGGVGRALVERTLAVLRAGRACVLDADALTSFQNRRQDLMQAITATKRPVVLTPHEGEFAGLFGQHPGDRLTRARLAAAECGATVLLKGPDTVIANPDGRAAITANATAVLATAGSGDVLAGMICGLLAQGLDGFEAASAASWLHAEAGGRFGTGLIAEDVVEGLPPVLAALGDNGCR